MIAIKFGAKYEDRLTIFLKYSSLGIKSKNMALGIQKGLDACSHLLIEKFPATVNNINELSNKVVIKE